MPQKLRFRHLRGTPGVIVLALSLLRLPPARAAEFELGFEGLPEAIRGSPGELLTVEFYATLTTTSNESPDGAQGWSFAVGVEGGTVTGIGLDGVLVSTVYEEDHDRDEATPPIHHDPYQKDLGTLSTTGGFSVARVCRAKNLIEDRELGKYAGTAIVLNQVEKMVLQPGGTQRLARIQVETRAPESGECSTLSLFYVTETGWVCLDEMGRPVTCGAGGSNIVFGGGSNRPLEQPGGPVRVCSASFRRGDSNADGRVDISDAVFTLAFLYLGGDPTPCRDAADANDDGALDLSDGILVLNRLFVLGPSAVIPSPGMYGCGPDPQVDGLGCSSYASCP